MSYGVFLSHSVQNFAVYRVSDCFAADANLFLFLNDFGNSLCVFTLAYVVNLSRRFTGFYRVYIGHMRQQVFSLSKYLFDNYIILVNDDNIMDPCSSAYKAHISCHNLFFYNS